MREKNWRLLVLSRRARLVCAAASFLLVWTPAWSVVPTLPGVADIKQQANISTVTVDMGDTMNFNSCLNFKFKPKVGWCKGKGLFPVPEPALELDIQYQEPTALVEVGCLAGKTSFKNLQNAASRMFGSISQSAEQRCVEPIRTRHGEYRKYYFDVHVWGISDMARFESSASTKQALQSNVCRWLSKIGKITTVANVSQGGFLSFGGIGSTVQRFSPANLAQGVKNFANGTLSNLANAPQALVGQIQGLAGQGQSLIQSGSQAVKSISSFNFANIGQTVGAQLSQVAGQGNSFNFSALSGSLNMSQVTGALGNLGSSLGNLANGVQGLTRLPGAASLPGAGQVTNLLASVSNMSGPLSSLSAVSNFNIANVQQLTNGLTQLPLMGTKLVQAANALAPLKAVGVSALEYQQTQVAALGGGGPGGRSPLVEAVEAMRKVGEMLESIKLGPEVDKAREAIDRAAVQDVGAQLAEQNTRIRLGLGPNGELQAQGFIENGGSQGAVRQALSMHAGIMSTLLRMGESALQLAHDTVAEERAKDVCYVRQELAESLQELQIFKNVIGADNFDTGIFPEATYLPQGYVQTYLPEEPSPSCQLTAAGYVPFATLEGLQKDVRNCHQKCVGTPRTGGSCELVPDDDAYLPRGRSCMTNRLSTVQVDGKFPACNGIVSRGDSQESLKGAVMTRAGGKYRYVERLDHRKQLEEKYRELLRREVDKAINSVQSASRFFDRYEPTLLKKCSSCNCDNSSSLDKMGDRESSRTGNVENLQHMSNSRVASMAQMTPVSNNLQEEALASLGMQQGATLPDMRQLLALYSRVLQEKSRVAAAGGTAPAVRPLGQSLGLSQARTLMGRASGLMNRGGIQQAASAQVSQYLPYGLWLGFASEKTDWMKPAFDIESSLMQVAQTAVNSTPLWAVCSGGSVLNSLTGTQIANVNRLNSVLGCVGSWGMNKAHGWAYNQTKAVGGALIGARGHGEAVKLGGIQPNLKGAQRFNLDYPPLYNQSPYAQAAGVGVAGGGKHKGSGCYDVGTSHTGWYSPGEDGAATEALHYAKVQNYLPRVARGAKANPNLEAQMDEGHYVFTYWKRTRCKVKFAVSDALKFIATGGLALPTSCTFEQVY
jgi:hypothetical protein